MTKLLEQAFESVSTKLSHESQNRLAQLMLSNLESLEGLLEEAMEERSFDASAIQAIESDRVQLLLKRVAEKHGRAKTRRIPSLTVQLPMRSHSPSSRSS